MIKRTAYTLMDMAVYGYVGYRMLKGARKLMK